MNKANLLDPKVLRYQKTNKNAGNQSKNIIYTLSNK
jgi:hypothetical protein